MNLFTFMAEEVREILAQLGYRSLNEIIGHTELLRQVSRGAAHLDDLDLNSLLAKADPATSRCTAPWPTASATRCRTPSTPG